MKLTNGINTKTADGRRVALIFAAVEHQCGLRVCCVCKVWIGLAPGLPAGQITHGYCDACFEAEMRKVDAILPAVDGSHSNQATDAPAPSDRRLISSAADHAPVFPSAVAGRGFGAVSPARLPVVFSDAVNFKPEVRNVA